MTTSPTQGEHAQPEAPYLQLADLLASGQHLVSVERKEAADAIRTLHAQVAALTAAPQGGAYAELPTPHGKNAGEPFHYTADQMRDFADRTHALRASHGKAPAGAAEIEELRALSVTHIMIDIVPGDDGMGHEVYAKSVDDVVNKMAAMGEELEDWQLGIRRYQPAHTAQPAPAAGNWIAADDVNRLVRELDVCLNGEAGAAAQASLCDVVAQVRHETAKRGQPLLAAPAAGAVAGPDLQPLHNLLYLAQRQTSLGAMRCVVGEARLELAKVRDAAPTPAAQHGEALDRVTNFRHEAEGMVRGGEWVRLSDVRAALAQKDVPHG